MAVTAPSRARLRAGALLVALLALAVWGERERWFGRLRSAAEPRRLWIWTSDPPRSTVPLAFLAVRDFQVDLVPPAARLSVIGDAEYAVWVNGHRIGSGAYTAGAPFDVYEVAPLLAPGRNRVLLELRSATGSGGATLRVEDDRGGELVATDDRWYVFRRGWVGLLKGKTLFPTERAAVLGFAPFGRWELPAAGPLRPRFEDVQVGPIVPAQRFRRAGETSWRRLAAGKRRALGGRVQFDFGAPVTGYLHLRLGGERVGELGLVRFGDRPRADERWQPDAIAVPVPRRGQWQDAVPRRFRYVEVVGLPAVRGAAVIPVVPAARAALAPAEGAALLGLRPDPVRVPVVDEIWKRWGDTPTPTAAPDELTSDAAGRNRARPRGRGGRRRRETG